MLTCCYVSIEDTWKGEGYRDPNRQWNGWAVPQLSWQGVAYLLDALVKADAIDGYSMEKNDTVFIVHEGASDTVLVPIYGETPAGSLPLYDTYELGLCFEARDYSVVSRYPARVASMEAEGFPVGWYVLEDRRVSGAGPVTVMEDGDAYSFEWGFIVSGPFDSEEEASLTVNGFDPEFMVEILPLPDDARYDVEVRVKSMATGAEKVERVSGGAPVVDAIVRRLRSELSA